MISGRSAISHSGLPRDDWAFISPNIQIDSELVNDIERYNTFLEIDDTIIRIIISI
jgi:hypothetical protein